MAAFGNSPGSIPTWTDSLPALTAAAPTARLSSTCADPIDSDGTLVTGDTAVPSAFYVTRISSRLSWITSIIGSSDPGLANISARVTLGIGDQVCIGGFIIQGQPKRVGIRGLGPSIEVGGVPLPGRIERSDARTARLNWRGYFFQRQLAEFAGRGN